jgi:hypothetical protein
MNIPAAKAQPGLRRGIVVLLYNTEDIYYAMTYGIVLLLVKHRYAQWRCGGSANAEGIAEKP